MRLLRLFALLNDVIVTCSGRQLEVHLLHWQLQSFWWSWWEARRVEVLHGLARLCSGTGTRCGHFACWSHCPPSSSSPGERRSSPRRRSSVCRMPEHLLLLWSHWCLHSFQFLFLASIGHILPEMILILETFETSQKGLEVVKADQIADRHDGY